MYVVDQHRPSDCLNRGREKRMRGTLPVFLHAWGPDRLPPVTLPPVVSMAADLGSGLGLEAHRDNAGREVSLLSGG